MSGVVERHGLAGRRVLVAASAGLDSTVLAAALAELAPRHGLTLRLGHVDHGLRGEASRADVQAVRDLASKLGVEPCVARVDPHTRARGERSRSRLTLQEAARELRYAALRDMAARWGGAVVATAHHLDDQAETVLLRLLRGSAPSGLGGIPESSPDGSLVRPLLDVSRAEIEAFAEEAGLAWREDASNRDPAYARNRLRRDWLPGLAREFNPQLLRTLANLAEAQRRDSEWLETLVEAEARRRFTRCRNEIRIALDGWAELPEALARRLARRALREIGGARDVSRPHLLRILAQLASGSPRAAIELPGGLRLESGAGEARLRRIRVEGETAC